MDWAACLTGIGVAGSVARSPPPPNRAHGSPAFGTTVGSLSGISSPTPTAQANRSTRAAGGIDPARGSAAQRFFWDTPALPIHLGGGGHEAPLPPVEASWRIHVAIPLGRASRGSRPVLHLADGMVTPRAGECTRPRRCPHDGLSACHRRAFPQDEAAIRSAR